MPSPPHFPSLSASHNDALSYNKLKHVTADPETRSKTHNLVRLLFVLALALLSLAAVIATVAVIKSRRHGSTRPVRLQPTKAIARVCRLARYQDLCLNSLVTFPGAMMATEQELVHMSMNVSLGKFSEALDSSTEIGNWEMESLGRSAYEDCLELLDHNVDLLARSLFSVRTLDSGNGGTNPSGTTDEVMTWLSAAVTNQDTCVEGLAAARGPMRNRMAETLTDLPEHASNSLAIFAATNGDREFGGIPIQNRRRRLLVSGQEKPDQPTWLSRSDRILLATPSLQIQADVVVSKDDGNGTVKTITEAIKMAPDKGGQRFIIHVKAGRYMEKNLKVGRKKTNVWFIGDGMGQTVISGHRSVGKNRITTFHTASFAATGNGFVAKDITFENEAGPEGHQAVALRVGADRAVIYRCEIKGYQDTLYAHAQRQFYRECDIYGTVDFIFGNAAAVFQQCKIYARKPMDNQKITITAQSRKEAEMPTGMSIHECQIHATPDLQPVQSSFQAYLGRPWKPFSRVVYMLSYISELIEPAGWLEWNDTSPIDKLYYGEYLNYGPGSGTNQRVRWPGVHSNMSESEASLFTVGNFIYGTSWLTPTGVGFEVGLTG